MGAAILFGNLPSSVFKKRFYILDLQILSIVTTGILNYRLILSILVLTPRSINVMYPPDIPMKKSDSHNSRLPVKILNPKNKTNPIFAIRIFPTKLFYEEKVLGALIAPSTQNLSLQFSCHNSRSFDQLDADCFISIWQP